MPKGKGTYGSTKGRPPKVKKMRKKGAAGAPSDADFKNAAKTSKSMLSK